MESTSTSNVQPEIEKKDAAVLSQKAEAVANRPVKTTLDLVKEKWSEAKKGPVVVAEAASAAKTEKPVVEGREPDGKFAKSDETKTKERVAREERALNALRRAKVSTSILDKLSDEDRIQMGLDLAEQLAKVDRQFSEKGKQTESRKEPEEGRPKADDLKKRDTALAESLAVDEDALKGLDERTVAIVKPLLEQAQSENDALAHNIGSIALDAVLSRLTGEFPEISDAKVRAEVVETVHRLAEHEDDDEADLMSAVERVTRDAIWRVCRDSIRARRSQTEKADSKAKAAGQPAMSTRQGDGSITVGGSTLERITAYKRLIDSGYTREQALTTLNKT